MKNNIMITQKNYNNHEIKTITSIEVAEMINKKHKDLLRDIRRYCNQIRKINENFGEHKIILSDFFQESTYISEQNKKLPCFNVTRKGCDFISNKLTGTKGTAFTARYIDKFHELENNIISNNINSINNLLQTLENITESVMSIAATYNEINEHLIKIEHSISPDTNHSQFKLTQYKKPYNSWFMKMQPKYKLLENYFNVTRGQLFKNILWEMENLYDVDTQQIQADYCYKNNLESCYPLEPYESNSNYRDMIESIVNQNLIRYGIISENDPMLSDKHVTIFSTAMLENK